MIATNPPAHLFLVRKMGKVTPQGTRSGELHCQELQRWPKSRHKPCIWGVSEKLPNPATAADVPLEEWKECRATIGRLDQILEDLRKFGFSIITGLLTAGAFLGNSTTSPDLSAAVFITVMVLVAALFSVDTYYQVLLSGAVEYAVDLEHQTLPIKVTTHLSNYARKCGPPT